MKTYVYKIENEINGLMYIGVTTNFKHRMNQHKYNPPTKMLDDTEEYPWEMFKKEILFEGSKEDCYKLEQKLIKKYKPYYNTGSGGAGGNGFLGEDNYKAKLTENEVIEIRKKYSTNNYNTIELAKIYNISSSHITAIVTGKAWKHVAGPISIHNKGKKLTNNMVKEIRIRAKNKEYKTKTEMAKEYGITLSSLNKVIRGDVWKSALGPIKGKDY